MNKSIVILTVVLSACSPQPVDKICISPPRFSVGEDGMSCVHREAYQLARASGSSKQIAEAVVAGCVPAIQEDVEEAKAVDDDKLYSELYDTYLGFANYYVTQARAGHCEIPSRGKN